ncbi:aromatic prenyltransferase [Aspergillus udagawae]|nr:aromatic prenyltransferase [Aspergillus udagawae]
MTVGHVLESREASPFKTIRQHLASRGQDINGWWGDIGPLFARMLQVGQYSVHEQYRHLLFLSETVIPALGPYPNRYHSALTALGWPVEYSLNFHQDGPPRVRIALEPIDDRSGTPADPFNHLPSAELVSAVARMNLPAFDTTLYHHFAKDFILPTADAARLGGVGLFRIQRALGFDLRGSDIAPKGYAFMRLPHMATKTPTRELILQSIGSMRGQVKSNWMAGLTVVDEYIVSAGGYSEYTFLAWDFVSPALSRLKLYGMHLQVTLAKAEEVWTVGGRFNDPGTRTGWGLFQRLWNLLGINPRETAISNSKEDDDTPASDYQAPLLWNYEIQPGSAHPIPKLYLCVHGLNDLAVALGLAKFFASVGWVDSAKSYVDDLASM